MTDTPYRLVLLRHGESEWNAKNLFTGWVDVALSEKGRAEAERGGPLLAERGILPDVLHTSRPAARDRDRARSASNSIDRHWIPVRRSWRLNERHYGALQGKNKKETLDAFGEEQFMLWRRSYDTPPPPLDADSEFSQVGDPRYVDLPPEIMPRTECLADVLHAGPSLLVRRHRPRPAAWPDRAGDRPRQLAARPRQAPRRHVRTRPSSVSTSRPASRCSTTSTTRCGRSRRAASTSTRRPPRPRSRRSRNRAANRHRVL